MKIGYLHLGPPRSGVRRYGAMLAQEARRCDNIDVIEHDIAWENNRPDDDALEAAAKALNHADVIHVQFSSKIWGGPRRDLSRVESFLRWRARPLVVSLHDVYDSGGQSRLTTRADDSGSAFWRRWRTALSRRFAPSPRAMQAMMQAAAATIVHSREEVDRARRMAPYAPIRVIPHFVERRALTTSPEKARGTLGLAGKRVVTLAGFIVPRKGYGLMLDAVSRLPDDVAIVFAGGAPVGGARYVERLQETIRACGLADRATITGYLDEDTLERYLCATHLAVCPFDNVSTSGSLATWISAERPILASDLPQIDEYNRLEPGAIATFQPYSADVLAEAICRLLADGGGDRASHALARLKERLSITVVLNDYVGRYREAAEPTTEPANVGSSQSGQGVDSESAVSVAFLPEWFGNPYQRHLGEALSLQGVRMIHMGSTAWSIACALLRTPPKILHLHWLHAFYEVSNRRASALKLAVSWAGLMLARLRGTRMVWTAHNLRHHENLAPRLDRWITRWVVRRADAIIAHCPAAKQQVFETFHPPDIGRIHVVPHGHFINDYPNEMERPPARRELDLPDDAVVFLFLGQVRPYKGVLELVDSFRRVDMPDARLLIAGKPLRENDVSLIRDRIADNSHIIFHPGFVPDQRVQTYMNACDAVVLPYRDVLTSGAAILAMSFARACVAPRLGCLPDLFEVDGGILYDPDDPDGLCEALRSAAMRRDELAEMGTANLQQCEQWPWTRVAAAVREIYRRVGGCVKREGE